MKKSVVITSILILSCVSFADDIVSLRQPASLQQAVVCTLGDGKAGTSPKTISMPLIKSSTPSINQQVGDYKILAQWIPQANSMSVGVIETVSGTTASTYFNESSSGSLFVSKNHQSVDLNCHIAIQNSTTPSSGPSQTAPKVQSENGVK